MRVLGGLSWRQLTGGGAHTCGITTNDRAYCWGDNGHGQLGDGTLSRRPLPVRVAGGLRFGQIEAGAVNTCAVTTADRAYCWGNNLFGQLGDGRSIALRGTPGAVAGTRRFDHLNVAVITPAV